jgi:hypothetical protein
MRTVNRRKWKRFKSKPPLVLSVQKADGGLLGVIKSKVARWGPIEDLSMGGLCVQYIAKRIELRDYDELSLQVGLDGRKVTGIAYKISYDLKVQELPSGIVIRKAGLRFENLNQGKKTELERFIDDYTEGEIVDTQSDSKSKNQPECIYDRDGTVINPIRIE